ncbi:unnamed protein product [Arctia plantaginis]|uniref:15-cis-phytoene synthase n=1 Tax=Arctia plantaginis TaxID=874455 RepID=A0A8S0ZGR8_ARCPL|nr:unnamed protein product [Arctia plantaginis]
MNRNTMLNNLLKTSRRAMITSRALAKESISNKTSVDYCANIVKQHDYENFLATLLMTNSIRSPAFVIRAFNVEIARIQDRTSDVQTAAFRLQFWHDAVKDMFKAEQTLQNIPANPIAQELFKVSCCCGIQKRHLEKLISSRSHILKSKHFQSLEDIEKYAEESVSSIYYLLLSVADIANVHADHAASHLGKAQGIANILRSVYISSMHRMVSLPMDILMKNKISQEDVLRGVNNENMRNVVFEVASRANSHLQKAKSIDVPKTARQIFLPAITVEQYLTKLQKNNFDIFDKSLLQSSPFLPLRLYYNRMLNKF